MDRYPAELLKGTTEMLILSVLVSSPQHGYGLLQELRRRSADRCRLREGTLYPQLHKLERDGSIAARDDVHGGRTRRVYEVLPAGRERLDEQRRQWRDFAAMVDGLLGDSEGGADRGGRA